MNLCPLALAISTCSYTLPLLAETCLPCLSEQQDGLHSPAMLPASPARIAASPLQSTAPVPLVQQASRHTGEGIKLLGKILARSSWFEEINPAAADPLSRSHLLADNRHRFWYYRLQNVLLTGEKDEEIPNLIDNPGIVIPEDPRDHPQPFPQPQPQPEPEPPKTPVTPLSPLYFALPDLLLAFDDTLQARFHFAAQQMRSDDHHNMFVYGYAGGERYHSAERVNNATSRYQGWLLGTRWSPETENHPLSLSLGVHKGSLSSLSELGERKSQARLKTEGINAQVSVQQPTGLQLVLPLGLSHAYGNVRSTDNGEMAQFNALIGHAGIDMGWRWQYGAHSLTPLLGTGVQFMRFKEVHEGEGKQIAWHLAPLVQLTGGVSYDYQPLAQIRMGAETRYAYRDSRYSSLKSSHDGEFALKRGHHRLQVSGYVSWQLHPNVTLGAQLQAQQRLDRDGVSDWNMLTGINVSF